MAIAMVSSPLFADQAGALVGFAFRPSFLLLRLHHLIDDEAPTVGG
jgi:hypothetical protein